MNNRAIEDHDPSKTEFRVKIQHHTPGTMAKTIEIA
jgi:hypothetical protein